MYTHELINLFKTFSDKELMKFGKFLNSPYFNNRKQLSRLYRVLRKFHPNYEGIRFTKENLFKLIYGNIKFNDSTFRNLMSDLLLQAMQFVKQEGIEDNEIESSFYLTQELFNRECYGLFRTKMGKTMKSLDERGTFDSNYFFSRYKVETDSFYVNLLTQKVLKKKYVISESERLIEGIVCILNYFFIETIKHNDNLLQYSRSYNVQDNVSTVSEFLEIFNFDKLIKYIRKNPVTNIPVVEVFYNLLQAFTHIEDEKHYFEFKKSLFQCSKNLGITDNNFLHLRLIGYCIQKMNLGLHSSFNLNEEIFELYKVYTQNEFYKTETSKFLPFDTYRNVLLNSILVKKLSYMENFIRNFSNKLLPEHISGVENYSYALLNFEKKAFDKALNYLNRIKFDQFVFKLDMKNLQLKINYELNHLETAISTIDSYRHFLKNNVLISESRREMHNNFANYTGQLIQYKLGSKRINLPFISHKVEMSKKIFDKVWLKDKLKELMSPTKMKRA